MRRYINLISGILLLWGITGCVEPYEPPTVTENPDFLVVDAFADVSKGTVNARVSRTIPLDAQHNAPVVDGVSVWLDEENGFFIPLDPHGSGRFSLSGLNLNPEKRYRLYIQTVAGREYQSAYMSPKTTPAIDTVSYYIDEFDELNITVSTHDETGDSDFYRWSFVETYQYQTRYTSSYVIINEVVYDRKPEDYINVCWRSDTARGIYLGNTTHLREDVVKDFVLQKIPRGDIKLQQLYSINVVQQALSEQTYNYLLELKKTTESLGGLFDPMPSQVTGNITCLTDPGEIVIGYFDVGSVTEKRIFIDSKKLPDDFGAYRYAGCPLDTLLLPLPEGVQPNSLVSGVFTTTGFPTLIGFTTSVPYCVDCRAMGGGKPIKPDFWP